MKILAVADEECKALWDYFTPDKLEGVELIIACGDLSRHYLEYLATMAPVPLLYVHGNHDESYDTRPAARRHLPWMTTVRTQRPAHRRAGRQLPLPAPAPGSLPMPSTAGAGRDTRERRPQWRFTRMQTR